MSAREILASNLRRRRAELGLSQEELAHRAQVDRTYISSIERQVYGPTVDVVDRLAAALKMQAWQLLQPLEE